MADQQQRIADAGLVKCIKVQIVPMESDGDMEYPTVGEMLSALAEAGYSVQLSTNRDTSVTSVNKGRHGWTCTVKSVRNRRHKSQKPGVRVRSVRIAAWDAARDAYKAVESQGGL